MIGGEILLAIAKGTKKKNPKKKNPKKRPKTKWKVAKNVVVKKKGIKKKVKDGVQNKCYLYNCDTKEYHYFQFIPSDLPRGRGVNYSTITSPGMAYPVSQFINGDLMEFDVDLVYNERYTVGNSKGSVKRVEKFIESLCPPYKNTKKFTDPPKCKFAYGTFSCDCVVTHWKISNEERNSKGIPITAEITLSLRRI